MARRAKRGKQNKLINFLVIGITFSIMFILGIEEYKDSKVKKQKSNIQYNAKNLSTKYDTNEENQEEIKSYPKVEIPKEYKDYNIVAKLEIPKIELETYILSTYSVKALNISPTKFWGADPNKPGNFCIAGHNTKAKNMFHNLRNLKIEDTLWLSDNEIGKVQYEIYDIYTVYPEDVQCLSQETEGKKEITLITCSTDSKKRIIVKAKEKE